MRLISLFVVVATCVAGCSSTSLPPPDPASTGDGGATGDGGSQPVGCIVKPGSRLLPRYVSSSTGLRQFSGTWFDSTRHENCAFSLAVDGSLRCLPPDEEVADATALQANFFADEGCTQPLLDLSRFCNHPPTYVRRDPPSCVASTRRFYSLVKATPTVVYGKAGDKCRQRALPPAKADSFFRVGDEVDAALFVAGQQRWTGDTRLQWSAVSAEDGAQEECVGTNGAGVQRMDSQRIEVCRPTVAEDGKTRCLPEGPWVSTQYADATCVTRAVQVAGGLCNQPVPTTAQQLLSPTCASGPTRVREVDAQLNTVYTLGQDRQCIGSPVPTATSAFAVGKEIDPSAFAPLSLSADKGGRLVAELMDDGSTRRTTGRLLDTGRSGEACTPRVASDGKLRCLPSASAAQAYYSDASCSHALPLVPVQRSCQTVVPAYVEEVLTGTCRGGVRLRTVGAKANVSKVYAKLPSKACRTSDDCGCLEVCTEGACVATANAGAQCRQDADCGPGLSCDTYTGGCIPKIPCILAQGSSNPFECPQGFQCFGNGYCVQAVHLGCQSDAQCGSCASCLPSLSKDFPKLCALSPRAPPASNCVEVPLDTVFDFYQVGAELSPSSFVELSVSSGS